MVIFTIFLRDIAEVLLFKLRGDKSNSGESMKILFFCLTFFISAELFSCEEKILRQYRESFPQNEHHYLTGERVKLFANQDSCQAFGITVVNIFDQSIDVYLAASEYMGGYGVEALMVEPKSCKILKITNLYSE